MLIEFSVGNYRSFKDIVTFSLLAADIVGERADIHLENTFTTSNNLKLLKSAAIYGANASGKSNLAAAIQFMRWFVVESFEKIQANGKIEVEEFRLSTETEKVPSYFEAVFIIEGKNYKYGFELDKEQVISEWLFYQEINEENIEEKRLFEREQGNFTIESEFSEEGKGIVEKTRDNALFISVVAQFNGKISKRILAWFQNLYIISGLHKENLHTIEFLKQGKYKDEIIQLIKKLDLGIHDINISFERLARKPGSRLVMKQANEILSRHWKYNLDGKKQSNLESFGIDKNESEGTKELFALAGILIDSLKEGKFLLIDEFDSSLHPLISCAIIDLFNSKETNPYNAQFVFITHDTNLLNILRRDQIWFTEQDIQQATHLYS
jgi:AAA15 family ATPase/GTPase